MNDQTKETYEYFFKDQFQNPIVVDDDVLNRNLETIFGKGHSKGDKLLYCITAQDITNEDSDMPEIELKFKFLIYPLEFESFMFNYQFSRFSPTSSNGSSIPIFIERNKESPLL